MSMQMYVRIIEDFANLKGIEKSLAAEIIIKAMVDFTNDMENISKERMTNA